MIFYCISPLFLMFDRLKWIVLRRDDADSIIEQIPYDLSYIYWFCDCYKYSFT